MCRFATTLIFLAITVGLELVDSSAQMPDAAVPPDESVPTETTPGDGQIPFGTSASPADEGTSSDNAGNWSDSEDTNSDEEGSSSSEEGPFFYGDSLLSDDAGTSPDAESPPSGDMEGAFDSDTGRDSSTDSPCLTCDEEFQTSPDSPSSALEIMPMQETTPADQSLGTTTSSPPVAYTSSFRENRNYGRIVLIGLVGLLGLLVAWLVRKTRANR